MATTRAEVGGAASVRSIRIAEVALAAMGLIVLFAAAGEGGFGGDYPAGPVAMVVALTGLFGIVASEAIDRSAGPADDPTAIRIVVVCVAAVLAFVGTFVTGALVLYPLAASLSVLGLYRIARVPR